MKPAILLLTLALAACAEYRTLYRLDPPATDAGHACVSACDHSKAACASRAVSAAPGQYQRCLDQAENSYEQCQAGTTSKMEKKMCYRPVCAMAPSVDDCDTAYRSCFADCGGQIWSRQECVKNC